MFLRGKTAFLTSPMGAVMMEDVVDESADGPSAAIREWPRVMDDQQQKTQGFRQITDQEMSEEEVRRATRELAAYFKGRRSHREALAALKRIKRFVRARQKEHDKTTRYARTNVSAKESSKRVR